MRAAIDALIAAGADPKAHDRSGATPLMLASASGQAAAVKALLDARRRRRRRGTVARGDRADVRRGANRRADAMKLADRGGRRRQARRRKVVDLKAADQPRGRGVSARRSRPRRTARPAAGGSARPHRHAATQAPARRRRADGSRQARLRRRLSTGTDASADAAAHSGGPAGAVADARGGRGAATGIAGLTRQFRFAELVSAQGGLTPLLFAVRQGHRDGATLLLDAGADVNTPAAPTTPARC